MPCAVPNRLQGHNKDGLLIALFHLGAIPKKMSSPALAAKGSKAKIVNKSLHRTSTSIFESWSTLYPRKPYNCCADHGRFDCRTINPVVRYLAQPAAAKRPFQ